MWIKSSNNNNQQKKTKFCRNLIKIMKINNNCQVNSKISNNYSTF